MDLKAWRAEIKEIVARCTTLPASTQEMSIKGSMPFAYSPFSLPLGSHFCRHLKMPFRSAPLISSQKHSKSLKFLCYNEHKIQQL
jgi:hypothetical protein